MLETKGSPRRKQNQATAKNIIVGKIPQNTPSTNVVTALASPLLSEYNQIKTIRVVSGMAAIRPPREGYFFPRSTHDIIRIFENNSFKANGILLTNFIDLSLKNGR